MPHTQIQRFHWHRQFFKVPMLRSVLLFLLIMTFLPVQAQMEKIVTNCDDQMCFFWWPVLPTVQGWHHERESSYRYSANAQAPDGKTFAAAEAVIYAKAIYKPRVPQTTSLQALIDSDIQRFRQEEPGMSILPASPLSTADGQVLQVFRFAPETKGNWELTAYGEESEFYILFTLSARSETAMTAAKAAYSEFINQYREKSVTTMTNTATSPNSNFSLTQYSLTHLQMIGMVPTKAYKMGLLQAPDNLILRVKPGDIVGKENGTVIDVTEQAVRIQLPGQMMAKPKIIELKINKPTSNNP